MKAVVLESKNGMSVILTEDGSFQKVRKVYTVGETIEWKKRKQMSRGMKRFVAAAAAACLIIGTGTYSYNNTIVYAAVQLSNGPAIEYELNRRNQVLRVRALDDTSKELAEELNEMLRREGFESALDQTFDILEERGLAPEDTDMEIQAEIRTRDDRTKEALRDSFDRIQKKHPPRRDDEAGSAAPEEQDRDKNSQGAPKEDKEDQGQGNPDQEMPERRQNNQTDEREADKPQERTQDDPKTNAPEEEERQKEEVPVDPPNTDERQNENPPEDRNSNGKERENAPADREAGGGNPGEAPR